MLNITHDTIPVTACLTNDKLIQGNKRDFLTAVADDLSPLNINEDDVAVRDVDGWMSGIGRFRCISITCMLHGQLHLLVGIAIRT